MFQSIVDAWEKLMESGAKTNKSQFEFRVRIMAIRKVWVYCAVIIPALKNRSKLSFHQGIAQPLFVMSRVQYSVQYRNASVVNRSKVNMNPTINRRTLLHSASGLIAAAVVPVASRHPISYQSEDDVKKDLIYRTTNPSNAEPALSKLVKAWQTPTELFYVRSHAPNPEMNTQSFRIKVEGMVRKPMSISLDDLLRMPQQETTATLTCAGNRRSEYNGPEYRDVPEVGGVQWEGGTIGNANWAGVNLADVLKRAEVKEGAKHVWFEGLDQIPKNDKIIGFGGSIPIEKAMVSDGPGAPLLTHKMNGAPLTPDHGFPVRMVVPGYIGARSVKWLGKIVVSDRPSPNHYVATAYKIVRKTEAIDWSESGPIYRYPINGAICTPEANKTVASGLVELTGYALPAGRPGSRITAILISADQGKSWTRGELTGQNREFCWQLWRCKIGVNANTKELILKAVDSSGGFMPARVPWNAKGYLRNSWYRMPIKVS